MDIPRVNNSSSPFTAGAGGGDSRLQQLEQDIQKLKNQIAQGGGGAQGAQGEESLEERLKRLEAELAQLKGQEQDNSAQNPAIWRDFSCGLKRSFSDGAGGVVCGLGPPVQSSDVIYTSRGEKVAIDIAAISNMVNMLRGHEKLEMLDAEDHKLKHLLDKLSEHGYGGKIELPAEDPNRPVRFDDPKKNPQ
eukprot:gene18533-22169_t